uniref:Uncharacterized protein n=1 Tax=uncultured prokaryote TaxID=198431 RepID=A0A0H5Q5Z7_9ZZZZ|nr:hypothetical protein [uncultured prokaryote]
MSTPADVNAARPTHSAATAVATLYIHGSVRRIHVERWIDDGNLLSCEKGSLDLFSTAHALTLFAVLQELAEEADQF